MINLPSSSGCFENATCFRLTGDFMSNAASQCSAKSRTIWKSLEQLRILLAFLKADIQASTSGCNSVKLQQLRLFCYSCKQHGVMDFMREVTDITDGMTHSASLKNISFQCQPWAAYACVLFNTVQCSMIECPMHCAHTRHILLRHLPLQWTFKLSSTTALHRICHPDALHMV